MPSRIARRLAAGVAVGLVLALGACSSEEQQFSQHLQRAQELEKKGQIQQATAELRGALQLDPKSADVNFRLAELLARDNHLADAAFYYRETTRLDPFRSDAALAEAKLILFDDTARAEELVAGVLEREPDNATAYIRRSEIALARGKAADARLAALTAVELAPGDGMAQMQLGIVNLARLREAAAKQEKPEDSVFQEAEKALKKAAELFPHGVVARVELGRLYSVWKEHAEQAIAAFRDAIAVADTDESRARAAAAAIRFARATKNDEFERASLQTLVEVAPANLEAWDDLAALEERSRAGAGDAVYVKLFATRGADVEAHLHYAGFLYSRQRYDEAFAHLDEQAKTGTDPAAVLEYVVALRLRRSEKEAAQAALDRLVKEYPTHPRTELAKGRMALAEDRSDEAADDLRRYAGMEETPEGQHLLAIAELRRRNFPAATAAVDRALLLEGGTPNAETLRFKATVHAAAGDSPQVLQTLNRVTREFGELRPSEKLMYAQALYATGRAPAGKALLEEQLAGADPPVPVLIEFAQREGANEPERARRYLEQVVARNPGQSAALRLLTQLDINAGRAHDALARLDAAAASGPLAPPLILLRAQIFMADKEYAKAEAELRSALAAAPELPGAPELLANLYIAQNRSDEAIASLEAAEKTGALPAPGEQLLARLYASAGHRDAAVALYEKVVAAHGDLPGARSELARLLAEQGGDLERALALAQEAEQAAPESAEVADTVGFVYLEKGLFAPALEQFRYAVELSSRSAGDAQPERPEYHYHVGLALKALGRNDQAVPAFERALRIDDHFAHADDARRELDAAKTAAAPGPG